MEAECTTGGCALDFDLDAVADMDFLAGRRASVADHSWFIHFSAVQRWMVCLNRAANLGNS